ncbi:MAG: AarF/ABC1/UbiB kinase family protein [Leptospira sp.]|nr:AarF/ABC1/UbiB kinase family protein [Leptospira sp.]
MDSFLDRIKFGINGSLRMLNSGTIFTVKTAGLLKDFLFSGNTDTLPIRLREAFEELGATYIKLGQFIASAPSLFPKEFVEEMQKCLDSVRPIPYGDVKRIIESELKGKISDHFRSIEEIPIASASIAQVHGAITKDGLDVVIKVQRPDIESTLGTDMNLIYFSTVIFEKIAPGLNKSGLSELVKDFQNSIMQEIDFIQEAKNIEEFDAYLLKSGESRAKVPRVYHELSTKKVLTMERLYGVPLTDPEKLKGYTKNPKKTLTDALDIWFSSLSGSGFFHADVHAGNLLALKDGRIGFIDFGIVGRISSRVWKGLMIFMEGMSLNRSDLMAKGLIDMDGTAGGIDEKHFAKDLDRILDQLSEFALSIQIGDIGSMDEGKMNRIMFDISDISKRNGLRIPREFGLLIKQMLYFDRYVKILAPEIDIIRDQKMFLH